MHQCYNNLQSYDTVYLSISLVCFLPLFTVRACLQAHLCLMGHGIVGSVFAQRQNKGQLFFVYNTKVCSFLGL